MALQHAKFAKAASNSLLFFLRSINNWSKILDQHASELLLLAPPCAQLWCFQVIGATHGPDRIDGRRQWVCPNHPVSGAGRDMGQKLPARQGRHSYTDIHMWAIPPVRLTLSGRNSGRNPERPRKRSQSVSWNSRQEYGWDPPSPIEQGI